jgi:hypothetical protein
MFSIYTASMLAYKGLFLLSIEMESNIVLQNLVKIGSKSHSKLTRVQSCADAKIRGNGVVSIPLKHGCYDSG